MDISLEAWNIQDTIHISNDAQEEGRSGPWSWKGSVQQCREIPGQGSRRGLIGELGRGDVLWDFQGGQERGIHLKCK